QRAPGLVSVDTTHAAARLVEQLSGLDFPRAEVRVAETGEVTRAGDGEPGARTSAASPRKR
ncbi:MAG TPA: hypothetical protein VFQ39_05980, partial [Longimicrobium sp.]|nr:hypothetical protein [Longimicrobium sp.]